MARSSRTHSSKEFGKSGSSSLSGMDAPMIGASASIMIDALVESESGATPPPPAISVKAITIALAVMFVIGVTGVAIMRRVGPPYRPVETTARLTYAADGSGVITGVVGGFSTDGSGQLMSVVTTQTVVNGGRYVRRTADLRYDSSTVFLLNGQSLSNSSDPDTSGVTVYDSEGWPARVSYVRERSASMPRATRVELIASHLMIDRALEKRTGVWFPADH